MYDKFIQKLLEKSIEVKNQIITIGEKHQSSHGKKSNTMSSSKLKELISDLEL